MRSQVIPLTIALFVTVTALHAQESVCGLFSHLAPQMDGRQLVLTGELIISKDSAVLGSAECEDRYVSRKGVMLNQWPTALSLRPSTVVSSLQLQQFHDAGIKADRLRAEGKTVRASASFSGRIRVAPVGELPGELTFDSFENLKVEALPDPESLSVVPICDLFQNLPASSEKRIAVRGEIASNSEGMWIVGRCKGAFYTDKHRWPVTLSYGIPAYYSYQNAKLYEAKWPSPSSEESTPHDSAIHVVKTATFVGILHMRSEYHVVCGPGGRYLGNGFGHLNGAVAELIVDNVLNIASAQPAKTKANDIASEDPERCAQATIAPQ